MTTPPTTSDIEQENGYYFVGQTSISVLKVVDCLKNGLSFDSIQQLFQLTYQEIASTKAFLEVNFTELESQYREDIEKFKNDILFKLRGAHAPSWKQRSTGFSGLAIGAFLLYGSILTFNDPVSRIILIPLACIFIFGALFLIYVQLRTMYIFQDYSLSLNKGFPYKSLTVQYDETQRIKISPVLRQGQYLYIQNRSGKWLSIICTDSISEGIKELIEYGQYDPALHFELPEEQSSKAK